MNNSAEIKQMPKIFREYKVQSINLMQNYEHNSRTHSEDQIQEVVNSINRYGYTNPILVDENNVIIAGHCRIEGAKRVGMTEIPTIIIDGLSDVEKAELVICDNKLALNAGWDFNILADQITFIRDNGGDVYATGFNAEEIATFMPDKVDQFNIENDRVKLTDKFLVPPFSVLDARQGYWQERKNAWLKMGIKSEIGRGDNLLNYSNADGLTSGNKYGKCLETGIGEKYGRDEMNATSIFDPVLCELSYLWFSAPGAVVLDPFAGGSVRGIVAAKLKRQYIGIDLRPEQIEANRAQIDLLNEDDVVPVWHIGDSRNIQKITTGVKADLIFTCPPYADLEVYSDDPKDLSTLKYDDFIMQYKAIINNTCTILNENRFAVIVVGDIRDKKGIYRNFVSHTIDAFIEAGLSYYNEAILVTMVGSLPIRATKQFLSGRKLGKTHQNVLVFIKGDPKKATEECGLITIEDINQVGNAAE